MGRGGGSLFSLRKRNAPLDAVLDLDTPLSNRGPRLSDLVYDRLREAILDGRLAAGELLRDSELSAGLGVSRMPIREAVQRLERAGLVETSASRYTRVTALTEQHVAEAWEYGGYLYGSVSRLAAYRMSEDDRALALTMLDEATAAAEPGETAATLGRLFKHLIACTGNSLIRGCTDVTAMIDRAMRVSCDAAIAARILEHRAALREAVVACDGVAAERAVRAMFGVL